jgi:hypothetical protein
MSYLVDNIIEVKTEANQDKLTQYSADGMTLQFNKLSTAKNFSISSSGLNYNDGTINRTTTLERIASVQQAFSAVELPTVANELKINNTIEISNGTQSSKISEDVSSNLVISNNSNQALSINNSGITTFNNLDDFISFLSD